MTDEVAGSLAAGARLAGRYKVLDHLGRGGMGSVYRALDEHEGREVALKLLTSSVTDGQAVVRFKREFRSASRLRHPSCVEVFGLAQDGDQWFITMEYVPGRAFELEPGVRAAPRRIVSLALQALAALDHIHAQQIVHRDIKPQNMLLASGPSDDAPILKLTDFGISKLGDMDEQLGVGLLLGSLPYMAPEQAAEGRVDPRSDLYALGVVLFSALTGQHPLAPTEHAGRFRPAVSEWCRLKIADDPLPLGSLAPGLPEGLSGIVDGLLARDPAARPATAAEVFDALQRVADEELGGVPLPFLPPLDRASYLASPALVGRDDELARLEQFLRAAIGGSEGGRVLAIAGEAGVGKSKLVAQLPGMVHGLGGEVYTGTCRAEGGAAYEPLLDFLSTADRALRADEAVDALQSDTARARSRRSKSGPVTTVGARPEPSVPTSTPTVAIRGDSIPVDPPSESDSESGTDKLDVEARLNKRWQFHRRVADALRSLADEAPVVVLVEDVHWADPAPLELLNFLLRTSHAVSLTERPIPWAVVVTHRPSPVPSALRWLCDTAREVDALEQLDVAPLDRDAATDLVASMLARPRDAQLEQFVERLVSVVGSRPLDVMQALHSLVAHGRLARQGSTWDLTEVSLEDAAVQAKVKSAIGDRAARFSSQTKHALAAAAIVGRSSDLDALEHLTGVDEALLLDCLDEAIRAGFLEEPSPGTYRFVHSRFRDAIAAELPEDVRASLHGAAADHLIENRLADDPTTIAYHCARSERFEEALRFGMRAARDAMADYAFSRAAALYEDVLRYHEATHGEVIPELQERFGTACLQAGRYDDAARALSKAIDASDDAVHRGELLRKAAEVEFRRPDLESARTRLEELLATLGFSVPRSRRSIGVGILREGGTLLLGMLGTPGLDKDEDQRRRRAMISSACAALAEAYYFSDFNRAVFYQAASVNAAEKLGPSPELTIAAAQQGYILSSFGQYDRGFGYLDRAREAADEAATPVEASWEAIMRAMSYHCKGDPTSAVVHTGRAEALLQRSSEPLRVRQAWTIHGEALAALGRYEQMIEVSQDLERLARELEDDRGLGWARYLEGHGRWRRGQHEIGLVRLRDSVRLQAKTGDLANGMAAMGRFVLALTLSGNLSEAIEHGREGAMTLIDKKLRNPACTLHGAFITAAAAAHARSELDRSLRKGVRKAIAAGRRYTTSMLLTRPAYLAGLGAWEQAHGNRDAAMRHFEDAAALAREQGSVGELADVEAVRTLSDRFAA